MRVALVSYRLGGTDGVSHEAAKWRGAFTSLGHEVTAVAGAGHPDVLVDGLMSPSPPETFRDALVASLEAADLVVVENVFSLPLYPAARDTLLDVLRGRPVLARHHDWWFERAALATRTGLGDDRAWRHVTLNQLAASAMRYRGLVTTTLPNHFALDPPPGRRDELRRALALDDAARLILWPSRVIPRKNVRRAIELAARHRATLWITGPHEDGDTTDLRALARSAGVTLISRPVEPWTIDDAYAAADLVAVTSTWEGFGNVLFEALARGRPVTSSHFPVLDEHRRNGVWPVDLTNDDAVHAALVRGRDPRALAHRDALAAYDLAQLPQKLANLVETLG